MNPLKLSFAVILVIGATSCNNRNTENIDLVVMGITADALTFNPLFTVSVDEGNHLEIEKLNTKGV